jgi:hypothetical protein
MGKEEKKSKKEKSGATKNVKSITPVKRVK